MLEREANRKYHFELAGSMVLYMLALFGGIYIAERMEHGALRTLILVAPMIPVLLVVWVIARHFRRMDEFVRLRSLEAIAISFGVTAGLSLTYGFLESAGFPRISMFWVWPVMGAVWFNVSCAQRLLKR